MHPSNVLERRAKALAADLRVLAAPDFLKLDLPPRDPVLGPVLVRGSVTLLRGAAGLGKSWLALSLAHAAACGAPVLGWSAPRAARVLYVDAQMPLTLLQARLAAISRFGGERGGACGPSFETRFRRGEIAPQDEGSRRPRRASSDEGVGKAQAPQPAHKKNPHPEEPRRRPSRRVRATGHPQPPPARGGGAGVAAAGSRRRIGAGGADAGAVSRNRGARRRCRSAGRCCGALRRPAGARRAVGAAALRARAQRSGARIRRIPLRPAPRRFVRAAGRPRAHAQAPRPAVRGHARCGDRGAPAGRAGRGGGAAHGGRALRARAWCCGGVRGAAGGGGGRGRGRGLAARGAARCGGAGGVAAGAAGRLLPRHRPRTRRLARHRLAAGAEGPGARPRSARSGGGRMRGRPGPGGRNGRNGRNG